MNRTYSIYGITSAVCTVISYRRGILFFLFSLFVAVSANRAWACGDMASNSSRDRLENACCSVKKEKRGACSENSGEARDTGQKCPDQGGCAGGHCPCDAMNCGPSGGVSAEVPFVYALFPFHNECDKRQAFYFAGHIPEAVFLPIWLPPQLRA